MPLISSFPWIQAQADNFDVDVVVIGAGIAGLIATEELLKNGHSVKLLEASTRVGGRVHLDHKIFGVPYDRGAHWMHMGEINPLLRYAKKYDFPVYPAPEEEVMYIGDREASAEEYSAYAKAYEATLTAIGKAGSQNKDVSPASVVPDVGEWQDLVHLNIGPYEMAKDFSDFSCVDWWSGESGTDWYCKDGYGAVVLHRVKDIPVELNTQVSHVKWGDSGVTVKTTRGDIKAKKCIITVSTGVLANDDITFDPALPMLKQEAFHSISMGTYNHLTLQFKQNFFGTGSDGYLIYKPDSKGAPSLRAMSVLTNISGTNISYCDVGGEFARELEGEGRAGGIDFALSELRKIFGSQVDKHFIKGDATLWGKNSLFHGSYASAEPGAFQMRRRLRSTVADRIYFAGEACSESEWATVNGAYKTGISVAKRIHRSLS